MKWRTTLVLMAAVFLSVNRMPAPIVEEEKPTPSQAPQQPEAPKQKHSKRSTSSEESPSAQTVTKAKPAPAPVAQGPARFAGTWTGKVNQGLLGHVQSSVTVNANASSVELSHNLGGATRPVAINGNSITWKSGVAGEITWTLTPNSDGQTAEVTMKGLMLNDKITFRRGRAPAETSHQSAAKSSNESEIPTAKPVPGKPGLVFSPSHPDKYIDVEGFSSGDQVKDPYSSQTFIVP
jgi:hypothetical protein